MHRNHAPTTDDIDNFRLAAHVRIADLLRGEVDLAADFVGESCEFDDELPLTH